MSGGNNVIRGCVGFLGLLGVLLIVLKKCSVIDWDWWIILAPIYAPLIILIVVFAVALWEERKKS